MTAKLIRPVEIVDAVLSASNVAETDYGAYNAGHAYALGDRAIVVAADVHKVYESLQNANTGHTPATSPTWWLEVSPTNRWKMFDGSVASQTANADSIVVSLIPPFRANSVTCLNVSAGSAQVTVTDAVEGVVYDRTIDLVSDSGITDWYSWWFEPIVRVTDFTLTDLPPYTSPTITISLLDPGASVKCGVCVIGQAREIGDLEWGARLGIQDFSKKDVDEFGGYVIVERAFRKRATFTLTIPRGFVDELQRLLESYRATPIIYIGTDLYSSTIFYGFYSDFSVVISTAVESICDLELQGLT